MAFRKPKMWSTKAWTVPVVDLVTETNKACEDLVCNHLKHHYPTEKTGGSGSGSASPAEITLIQLLEKSKKNKKGELICPRVEAVERAYNEEMIQAPDPTSIDPYQLYLNAAGNYDRKGRVFGIGGAAPYFFQPPTNVSRTPEAPVYKLGPMAQMYRSQHERDLDMDRMRREHDFMMNKLSQQFGWSYSDAPDPTCNPGPPPHSRDDFSDGGTGGDIGNPSVQVS